MCPQSTQSVDTVFCQTVGSLYFRSPKLVPCGEEEQRVSAIDSTGYAHLANGQRSACLVLIATWEKIWRAEIASANFVLFPSTWVKAPLVTERDLTVSSKSPT